MYIGNYYYKRLNKNKSIYMTPPKIFNFAKKYLLGSRNSYKNKKILASTVIKK